METLQGIEGLPSIRPGGVISIGNFDGMHRGHQGLLQTCDALRNQLPDGGNVAVITFEPHPLTVLRPEQAPARLTPPPRKRELLAAAGVDQIVELSPTHEVLDLSAEAFWQLVRDDAKPAHLVEGASFNFGKGREGTIARLREWTAEANVQLHLVEAVSSVLLNLSVVPVSSSLVRWLLSNGRVRDAAICLGRPYSLDGTVIAGNRRGRTIGFPTANLQPANQAIPADGVYAGRAIVDGTVYPAAVSIGTLPTFDGHTRQIEAHLIEFSGDLYGRGIRLELIDWIRDQRKFQNIDALVAQIRRDVAAVSHHDASDPARQIGVA